MSNDEEEKRIGVNICHCGKNIAGGVDIEKLIKVVKEIKGVKVVNENRFSCSEEGQTDIQDVIEKNRLNRFVVVACDPALHLATFQRSGERQVWILRSWTLSI